MIWRKAMKVLGRRYNAICKCGTAWNRNVLRQSQEPLQIWLLVAKIRRFLYKLEIYFAQSIQKGAPRFAILRALFWVLNRGRLDRYLSRAPPPPDCETTRPAKCQLEPNYIILISHVSLIESLFLRLT